MNTKVLEARIRRLEKLLSNESLVGEAHEKYSQYSKLLSSALRYLNDTINVLLSDGYDRDSLKEMFDLMGEIQKLDNKINALYNSMTRD